MSSELAFGVEPSTKRYRLRLARYKALAETISQLVRGRARHEGRFRLLDIGAGNGRTLRYLEAEGVADRVDFFGLDLSTRRLDRLYQRQRWRLIQADAEKGLPLAAEKFDCVICEQVLEHLQRPEYVLQEIARVLRPGGLLIAGVPNFPPLLYEVRRHVMPRIDRLFGKTRGHVQVFNARSFVRFLKRGGGFDVSAVRGFRIVTDLPPLGLQNYRWWWQLNRRLGQWAPGLCVEIQVLARRRGAVSPA